MVSESYFGWQIYLQPYIIRPRGSWVFIHAHRGDVASMMGLFRRREASPFDHDDCGRTLLHVCALYFPPNNTDSNLTRIRQYSTRSRNTDLSNLLISYGVDIHEPDNQHIRPIQQLLIYRKTIPESYVEFLLCENNILQCRRPLKPHYRYDSHAVHWRLSQLWLLSMNKDRQGSSLPDRVSLWAMPHFDRYWTPDMVRLQLWREDQPSRADMARSLKEHASLVHWISFRFGEAQGGGQETTTTPLWHEFMSEILSVSSETESLHALARCQFPSCDNDALHHLLETRYSTPLFEFLSGVWGSWVSRTRSMPNHRDNRYENAFRTLDEALKAWLVVVRRVCGPHSLEAYGQMECQTMRPYLVSGLWDFTKLWRLESECLGPRLVGIKYGADPQDWNLEWDLERERFAADFWQLIEAPPFEPPPVPGSWLADDTSSFSMERTSLSL